MRDRRRRARCGGRRCPEGHHGPLYCDLVGSTELADRLDAEDVDRLLRTYHDIARRRIETHGGTLEKFIGDGVVGIFGAPAAHEDDPERAVRAALRIVEDVSASQLGVRVRVAVHTGEALVRAGVDPTSGQGIVIGDCLNVASRLQAAAPASAVIVGELTHEAARPLFSWEELGALELKGKSEPIHAWRAIAPISRPRPAFDLEATPFVGRDFELEALVRLFERSRSIPSVEFVTVVGEAGIGKSRLVRELARHVGALPEPVNWRQGRCLAYGEGVGLAALGQIIRTHAGIIDTDDQAVRASKLDAVLTESDAAMASWMRDRLGPLVGLRVEASPPREEEAFTAWRRFVVSIAVVRPTVLVVEDLHWADDGLVAFLRHLSERTAGVPLLVVTTARPEIEDRHPTWLGSAGGTTVLSLTALPDREIEALVRTALPDASSTALAAVLERAGGNPLYAEQLAAMRRESLGPTERGSIDPTDVPLDLRALLAARIDALPNELRRVLLDAAIIGRTFWPAAVAALATTPTEVEPLLAELARREFVRPVFPSSRAGEAEFSFWHALTRDVAYGELPRAARMRGHALVAAWLTERAGSTLTEDADVVVTHLDRALELATATGATGEIPGLTDRLVAALDAAAEWAMGTDPTRAVAHLRRALELEGTEDQRRSATLTLLGRGLLWTGYYPEAARTLEEASERLRAAGDAAGAAELAAPLNIALANAGQAARGGEILAEARAILQRRPGHGLIDVIAEQAMAAAIGWREEVARALADEALGLCDRLGLSPSRRALLARGISCYAIDAEQGEADLRLAAERAEAEGDSRDAANIRFHHGFQRAAFVGPQAMLEATDETVRFCVAHGLAPEEYRIGVLWSLVNLGRWDEALEDAEVLRGWLLEHGAISDLTIVDSMIASVRLDRGESVGPVDGLAAGRAAGYPGWMTAEPEARIADRAGAPEGARRVLADALEATTPGELEGVAGIVRACLASGAPELARRAIELSRARTPVDVAGIAAAQATVSEAEGRLPAAAAGFADAVERWTTLGIVPERAQALAGLGRCLLALGEDQAGVARLLEARAIWQSLRAAPWLAEIDAALAVVPGTGEPMSG